MNPQHLWHSAQRLAVLLDVAPATIRDWARRGLFGDGNAVMLPGRDLRVSEAGRQFFLEHNCVSVGAVVFARTHGELRRKHGQRIESDPA